MRRVLRLTQTGRFVKGANQDTAHFYNGQSFSGFADAHDFCITSQLEGTELVLVDDNGEEQICIGIT